MNPDTTTPTGGAPTGADRPPPAWAGPATDPPPPPPRRHLVPGVALLVAGGLWLAHVLGADLRWQLLLPAALIAIGLAVLVGGRRAAAAGLVTIGTVLAVVAIVVALFPGTTSLSAGERTLTVTSVTDLDDRYQLGAGELTLDLRDLDLPTGTTRLEVQVGAGQLTVLVPPEATVVVDASVGLGEVIMFGDRVGGIAPDRRVTEDGAPGAGTLEIEANVGLGQLEVSR